MRYKRSLLLLGVSACAVLLLSACSPDASSEPEAAAEADRSGRPGEWSSLFDGETLEGWTKKGGAATYAVDNGTILGTSGKGPNTFLVSDSTYGDFELTAEVKLEDDSLNSGIQVRSALEERDGQPHLVGPQAEIEAAPPASVQAAPAGEAGYLYAEATGRGWLSQNRKPLKVFKNGAWNTFRIRAVGDSIQTWINDTPVARIQDPQSNTSGHIGLQVHSVPGNAHWQVRWRNIRLREIAGS